MARKHTRKKKKKKKDTKKRGSQYRQAKKNPRLGRRM